MASSSVPGRHSRSRGAYRPRPAYLGRLRVDDQHCAGPPRAAQRPSGAQSADGMSSIPSIGIVDGCEVEPSSATATTTSAGSVKLKPAGIVRHTGHQPFHRRARTPCTPPRSQARPGGPPRLAARARCRFRTVARPNRWPAEPGRSRSMVPQPPVPQGHRPAASPASRAAVVAAERCGRPIDREQRIRRRSTVPGNESTDRTLCHAIPHPQRANG